MNVYELIAFFILYSVIGWGVEVVYHVLKCGVVVNRGYLNGPVCPIYGFGMLAILVTLLPYEKNRIMLFLGGMILSTVIELVGGYALYHFFHQRWWDYSKEPFNLGGYICARFTVFWGVGAVLVMDMIHPVLRRVVEMIPQKLGVVILVFCSVFYFIDVVVTTMTVLKMRKEFEHLEQIAMAMREVSDAMTQKIGEHTIAAEEHYKELHDKHEEIKKHLLEHQWFGSGRILNAFPNLKIRHNLHFHHKEN